MFDEEYEILLLGNLEKGLYAVLCISGYSHGLYFLIRCDGKKGKTFTSLKEAAKSYAD